jgi:hypothetical protein
VYTHPLRAPLFSGFGMGSDAGLGLAVPHAGALPPLCPYMLGPRHRARRNSACDSAHAVAPPLGAS